MTRVLYADDPDLGRVRYCRRCNEWWPLDGEFWRGVRQSTKGEPILVCFTCQRHWNRLGHERRKAGMRL